MRYVPIDCGFHDEILARAVSARPVEIAFVDESGDERRAFDVIADVYTRASAEYLRLGSGLEIRLDRLLQVDGISAPGVPR